MFCLLWVYDMSKVYTLEGGFEAWTEAYPDNVENN